MATILKINDGENILEVTPPNQERILEIWTGSDDDPQSWRNVALDKEDATNLIEYLQKHLNELE